MNDAGSELIPVDCHERVANGPAKENDERKISALSTFN